MIRPAHQKSWAALLFNGLLLLAILTACQAAAPPVPTQGEILQLLYGPEVEVQSALDGQSVFVTRDLSGLEREQHSYTTQFETRLIYQHSNWQGDTSQLLVLTSSEPPECCTRTGRAVIGSALLAYQDGTWQVLTLQSALTSLGSLVTVPVVEPLLLGPQQDGLRLQNIEVNAGELHQMDLLLAEVEGRLAVVATIETHANNAGACPPASDEQPCWEFYSDYALGDSQHNGFYDLQITTRGTRLQAGTAVPADEYTRWIFQESAYQPVQE